LFPIQKDSRELRGRTSTALHIYETRFSLFELFCPILALKLAISDKKNIILKVLSSQKRGGSRGVPFEPL
jgi:hypothetical protein